MFNKKLKQRIQSLEAQVRRLIDENYSLQVSANSSRLQAESLKKALEMYREKMPLRDMKGRYVKKGVTNGS